MTGSKKYRWAWITHAVDKESTLQAIILAKSLAQVFTVADLVIIIDDGIPDSILELVDDVFDVVFPIHLGKSKSFTKSDFAAMFSWNFAMYEKCIVIKPDHLVLRNPDEYFELQGTTINNWNKDGTMSIFGIAPCYKTYKAFQKLESTGKYQNFDDLLRSYFTSAQGNSWFFRIQEYDNCGGLERKIVNTTSFTSRSKTNGSFKIVTNGTGNNQLVYKTWRPIYESLCHQLTAETISAFGLENNENILKTPVDGHPINGTGSSDEKLTRKSNCYKDAIAIVGYSCRFPGANNSDEFWDLLAGAGDGICQVPAERLSEQQLDDPRFTESKAGFLKCAIDEFDAKFFGISPREAAYMDPQQRLLVEVAWEALENAGIDAHSLKGSNTGVFSGVWTHDYERLINDNTSGKDFHHVVLGNAFSATSARVSYFLGLNGPNIATESGCSSSMVGLHLACESLKRKETNLALALGANVMIMHFPFSEIPILAKDGRCKTFDEKADGFGRAEGVAVIVLKRFSDAIKDGDRIVGLIRSSALSNEGTTSSFGTPSKLCQEIAVKAALKNACVEPSEVDYIEAHGTGTPIGDPIEFAALSAGYSANREKPIVIGSVKTNIGHTESAAGLAGLIKVLLSMKHEMIPPHRNFDTLNPDINLDALPAIIPVEAQSWVRNTNRKRLAGVSSFGISGTNVHCIIEEPPTNVDEKQMENYKERGQHILTLSAKSENALKGLVEKYVKFFDDYPDVPIGDATFTANTGRAHMKHRLFVTGKTAADFKSKLTAVGDISSISKLHRPKQQNIAFLFTGQGSQYSGMAKTLYDTNIVFQTEFDKVALIVKQQIGISLAEALWKESLVSKLDETIYSQPSIFAVEYALLKVWEALGVKPDYVLGHSVGEFAAATASGILNLEDAATLVCQRSKLVQSLPSGGMLAVRASKKAVSQLISDFLAQKTDDWLDIAVINSREEVVVAGERNVLHLFQSFCSEQSVKCQFLAATHAFHSRAMSAIMKQFCSIASKVTHNMPKCQYISGTTGEVLTEDNQVNSFYWERHARESVNFAEGINTLAKHDCSVFIEIGAHPILLALGLTNVAPQENSLWLPSLRRNEENWKTLLDSLGKLYLNGNNINWAAIDASFSRKKVELPTYPFQRQKYWIQCNPDKPNKILHPLLGRNVSIAGLNHDVYEHKWNIKDLSYLRDHQVANIPILPGAGFLEIILAAGKHSLLKTNSQGILNVENFIVECPLELKEDVRQHIQVVVSSEENSEKRYVKVYGFQNLNGYNDEKGWKQYSSASIFCGSETPSHLEENAFSSVKSDISEIKIRCPVEIYTEEFYKIAPEIGIYFGKAFQSIEKVWKGSNEVLAKVPIPLNCGNMKDYIYHPIVLDAMIQTVGLSMAEDQTDLYLPVGVEKFSKINETEETKCFYGHATWKQGKTNGTVKLYNEIGTLLAVMKGIRLVKTSISSFLNVINGQKNLLPGLYQEVWRLRANESPLFSRVDLNRIKNVDEHLEAVAKEMEEPIKDLENIVQYIHIAEKLTVCLILKAVLGIGWQPSLGCSYDIISVVQNHKVLDTHINLLSRFFEILEEQGYLSKWINDEILQIEWKVIKKFPSLEELNREEMGLKEDIFNLKEKLGDHAITTTMILCSKYIVDILKGNISAVSVLFGTEDKDLNALRVYTEGIEVIFANIRITKYLISAFTDAKSRGVMESSTLRILEVGAGSGATSKEIMKGLQSAGISFHYTFTDISPHFLEKAKATFSDFDCIEYKLLNIEKDPMSQEFSPFHYDVVVAANVIHATRHLEESLSNIRKLLAPSGILILQELLGPKIQIDFIFGVLEGFWRFKDYNLRTTHPCVTQDVWDKVLADCNFSPSVLLSESYELTSILVSRAAPISIVKSVYQSEKRSSWAIICDENGLYKHLQTKLEHVGYHVQLIKHSLNQNEEKLSEKVDHLDMCNYAATEYYFEKYYNTFDIEGIVDLHGLNEVMDDNDTQEDWLPPVLNICKYIVAKTRVKTRSYFVSRGVHYIGDQGSGDPAKATMWAISKCMTNELPELTSVCVDLDPDDINLVADSSLLFFEIFAGNELQVCFRNKKKYINRITTFPAPLVPLTLPRGRYQIVIPASKKINDVTFKVFGKQPLAAEEIEVMVKATALNFRDIFVILKPDMFKSRFDAVGTDFAGIVSNVGSAVKAYKVGDKVFGISQASCAASHVIVNSEMVLPKPKNFTFSDACTLPSVFLTAYYCLVTTGCLKSQEFILIHVASGGVGLIAIQIAKQIGATIIATAGSKRKRTYLRSIGVQHVFHSRDLTFGENIMKITEGRGVDMVLNSLTGPGFKETTLNACAPGARFVEMGKVNIWQPEEVRKLRPDVLYTIVDLEKVNSEEMRELVNTMGEMFSSGTYLPLPYSRFEIVNIKEALNYFLKAQHVGKVVVAMPEIREANGIQFTNELLFNDMSTYLITGGLGGIGLEVAKWMADCGARNLVVVGRKAPSDEVLKVLNNLRAKGCRILTMQVDIGDITQCKVLFSKIESEFPPLRGVIHSAGALSDGILVNQTWEKFQTVFNAKVQGGWNLHNLTKRMHLEHFVLFSSMAAVFGPMGQSNHGAANMFLDALTHYRHSLGLPSQTINWGAWSDVGAATNTVYGNEGAFGVKPFTPTQGIATLKFVMTHPNVNQIGVIHLDVSTFRTYFTHLSKFLIELSESTPETLSETKSLVQSEMFWSEINTLSLEDRVVHFRSLLKTIIRHTLKIPESEPLDEFQNFSEMGLDSLMAVEMRNKLQHFVGKKLTLSGSSLLDHPTINNLSKHLAEMTMSLGSSLDANHNFNVSPSGEAYVETETLIKHDTNLLTELKMETSVKAVKSSEIKNVLLTGATGHFGAYLLKDLLRNSLQKVNVYCLIRGKSIVNARKKLENNLKRFKLNNDADIERVNIILGDITDNCLGLSETEYEKMSQCIDAVFHLAAKANHVEKYKISKSNIDIRSVNVLGTVNILKFAANLKTKRVFYTTSYTTANRLSADGCISEDFPSEDNYGDGISFGYALSKFTSEKILKHANEMGIPCVAIRYPTLAGHSQSGHFTVDTNFMINLFLISCRMGLFLDFSFGWYAIPIDIASELTLELCFSDNTENGLYNIIQPVPIHSKDFVEIAKKRGIELRVSNAKEFQSALLKESKSDSFLQFFTDAYGDDFDRLMNFSCPAKATGPDQTIKYKASAKLLKTIPDFNERVPSITILMDLYMDYAKETGILNNFGVKFN